ncbi:MAG TPA: fimbrillin family protein [Candidatus Alistipes intestinipullorum]|nr:fimbrillin family protein [Candidatus Alistipes intestinipullorum]
MRLLLKYGWVLCLVAGACGGCKEGDDSVGERKERKPLEIRAEIIGAATAETRTAKDDFDSYDADFGFSEGDRIGFYSMRDEMGNDDNGYVNLPMSYVATENCFKNESLIVEYPNNFGYTFAYYPYAETNAEQIDIYKSDGSLEDLLIAGTSKISQGRIYLSFVHAFSMLIIVPGSGFEQAAEAETNPVQVVLEHGVKASARENADTGVIELILERDDSAPKTFAAQRRTNVTYTQDGVPVPVCYSVILPNDVSIDHIEMTDNHGAVQRLYPDLEPLERSWRYPINVSMAGTVPTVWPYEIQPWISDDQPIELGGTYGISNQTDFQNWIEYYNLYTSGGLSESEKAEAIEQLRQYGEMTDGKWKFQLIADIDCAGMFDNTPLNSLINIFSDEFDGRNHTLSNLNAPVTGTLADGGQLTNLKIASISISSDSSIPVGALALEMTGGAITDCTIENIWIETKGPVGAIVGEASAGTITENKASGVLLGSGSSPDGITGDRSANVTCENNLSSALIF